MTHAAILSILVKGEGIAKTANQIGGLQGDLAKADKTAGGMGKSLDDTGRKGSKSLGLLKTAAAGFVGVGIGAAMKNTVDAASDLSEQINKTKVVFRGSEKGVLDWSKTTGRAIGISQRAALEATGTFGNMLVPMGFARKEAAGMSTRMVQLAADMASFNNASPEDTLDALRAGLAGESEPLRRFGVFLNDARLKEEALRLGLYKGKGALDAAAKAQATYSLILKDSKDAQGDFERTSGSLANQQRILRARFEDLAAKVGAVLVPALSAVLGVFLNLGDGVRAVTGFYKKHETVVLAVAAAVGVLFAAYAGFTVFYLVKAAVLSLRAAMLALNASFLTNPIFLTVAAVTALAAGVVIAYRESETFRRVIHDAWGVIKDVANWIAGAGVAAWEKFGGVITDQFKAIADFADKYIGALVTYLKGLVDFIAGVFTGDWGRAWDGIKNMFKGSWDAMVALLELAWNTLKNVVRLGMIAIVEIVKGAAGALVSLGEWIVGRIVAGVKASPELVVGAGSWLVTTTVGAIKALPGGLVDVGEWMLRQIVLGLKTLTEALQDVGGWLKNRIVDALHGVKDGLVGAGGWILDKLIEGVLAIGGKIRDAIVELKDKIVAAIKSVFKDAIKIPLKIDLPDIPNPLDLLPGRGGRGNDAGVGPGNVGLLNSVQQIADYSLQWGLSGGRGHGQAFRPGDPGWHGKNRARDLSGPAATMLAFAKTIARTMGPRLLELIYTPLGYGIKNGQVVPNSFWPANVLADHFDHVHVAMEHGGHVKRAGWAVVGERGPELAHLPTGATVYSNRDSQAMLGGAGGPLVHIENASFGNRLDANAFAERMAFRIATAG
jgi:hypothetical protein